MKSMSILKNKFALSIIFVFFTCYVSAQIYPIAAAKVPAIVKSSFKKNFKSIEIVAWMVEGKNYTALFNQEGKAMTICLDEKGMILHRFFEIHRGLIPAKVWKSASKQKVDKYNPDNFGRGVTTTSDSVYVIEAQKEKERLFLFIADNGKLIKKYLIVTD